jgi:hypothetical protein
LGGNRPKRAKWKRVDALQRGNSLGIWSRRLSENYVGSLLIASEWQTE